jgi:beta-glucosidase
MHMHGGGFFEHVKALVEEGALPRARIEQAVGRILLAKFRLGLFEQRSSDPLQIERTVLHPDHRSLALEVSRRSLVLLKNEGATLPLSKQARIMVTGPNAADQSVLGDWCRLQPPANVVSILEGIRQHSGAAANVTYVPCGAIAEISDQAIRGASDAAQRADLVIAVLGENSIRENPARTSGENLDRASLDLPGRQLELAQALVATGKPLVVVLVNGAPICSTWLVEHAAAILEAWEPGMQGGSAVGEVLFGEQNPSGKLPLTFPRSVGHLKSYYNHKPSAYHRGRFHASASTALFPFGHGLSYTTFEYRAVRCQARLRRGEALKVDVELANSGARAGEEVVLLYLQDLCASLTRPVKELKAFRRVFLEPGVAKTLRFELPPEALAFLDRDLTPTLESGEFRLIAGNDAASCTFWLE